MHFFPFCLFLHAFYEILFSTFFFAYIYFSNVKFFCLFCMNFEIENAFLLFFCMHFLSFFAFLPFFACTKKTGVYFFCVAFLEIRVLYDISIFARSLLHTTELMVNYMKTGNLDKSRLKILLSQFDKAFDHSSQKEDIPSHKEERESTNGRESPKKNCLSPPKVQQLFSNLDPRLLDWS